MRTLLECHLLWDIPTADLSSYLHPLYPWYPLPFSGTTIDDLPQGMNVLLFTDKRCKSQRGDVKDIFKGTINQR